MHADRLHADGRTGLPGVQPHPPADTRPVDHAGRRRSHARGPAQLAIRGCPADRRHGQRAHPRSRRPGRGRHGDPDRQARALHGCIGNPPEPDAAAVARRRHRQRALLERSAVRRLAAPATARRRLRPPRRAVRRGRRRDLARLRRSSGRTSSSRTPCGSSSATAHRDHRRSTTTSRARRPSWSADPGGRRCGISGRRSRDQRVVIVGAGRGGHRHRPAHPPRDDAGRRHRGRGAPQASSSSIRTASLPRAASTSTPTRRPLRCAPPTSRGYGWSPGPAQALRDVIAGVRPTVLVGATGVYGSFDEASIREMARHVDRADHPAALESDVARGGPPGRPPRVDASGAASSPPVRRSADVPTPERHHPGDRPGEQRLRLPGRRPRRDRGRSDARSRTRCSWPRRTSWRRSVTAERFDDGGFYPPVAASARHLAADRDRGRRRGPSRRGQRACR